MRPTGKIGFYGSKTRALQRRLSFEIFGLTFKQANVYRYLGSRESVAPSINDVQIKVFSEVADRAYDQVPVEVPIGMERFSEGKMDFSRFGILNPIADETMFRMHIDDFAPLGRDMIIGDVFQLPFYDKDGNGSFWEVTDVDLKQEAEKFIAIIYATPLSSNRATREIPVDNSNDDVLTDIMNGFDNEVSDDVMTETPSYDEPTVKDDIDYRSDIQEDFLDDPFKSF